MKETDTDVSDTERELGALEQVNSVTDWGIMRRHCSCDLGELYI